MNIQDLISQGQTEQALQLLEQLTPDAVLLQSRYNGAKRQWGMGLIDNSEWSRALAQINYAALEMYNAKAPKILLVSAPTVVLNYFNFERQPGNDVGVVNKIFRTMHDMKDDLECPLEDLKKAVEMLHDIFGLPELVEKVEALTLSDYTKNTDAYKLAKRQKLVAEILKNESDFKATIKEIVAEEQKSTGWKEAFKLLKEEPSRNRWENSANLISQRLVDAIFDDATRVKWEEIVFEVGEIQEGLLWRRKFSAKLPDIERFLSKNLH